MGYFIAFLVCLYTKIDYTTHLSLTLGTQPGREWRKTAAGLDFTVFSEDGRLEIISREFSQGDLFDIFPLSCFMDVG